jgi:hypothetical protein
MKAFRLFSTLIVLSGTINCSYGQTPFACSSPLGYITAVNAGSVSAYAVNLANGTGTLQAANFYTGDINAIGYNVTDNFIWGKVTGASSVVRMGSNWTTTVFSVSGLPTGVINVGDVSAAGVLYMTSGNFTGVFTRVDVNPASATYLQQLSTVPANTTGYADIAFSPMDGNIYTVQTNLNLLRINPTTGAVTNIGALSGGGIAAAGSFGGVFFDAAGILYINRGDGDLYKVANPHLGATTAQFVGNTGTVTGALDGARCQAATVPLPLTLLNFSATKMEQACLLDWAIREGTEVERFEIERSADGSKWEQIGEVSPYATTDAGSGYSFSDNTPLEGINIYRLKIAGMDGTLTYSPSRQISFKIAANTIRVYPNPAIRTINIEAAEDSKIAVYNMIGQHIEVPATNSGRLSILNVSTLAAGNYTIHVLDVSGMSSDKLIVIK